MPIKKRLPIWTPKLAFICQRMPRLRRIFLTLLKGQEEVVGADDKLVKLNNLKGKISQKVSVITKEHKFFTENTVCPTCTQTIEEEFRLNRITDAQNKAKELQKGFQELEETIKLEQERERQFTVLIQGDYETQP
jgi:uncharacterized protein with PIN domain